MNLHTDITQKNIPVSKKQETSIDHVWSEMRYQFYPVTDTEADKWFNIYQEMLRLDKQPSNKQ